jgi:hypothetical protein
MSNFKTNTRAQSSPKRTVTEDAAFVLAAAVLVLASALTATAATASRTNHLASTSTAAHPPLCDGADSSICDGWPERARMGVIPSASTGVASGSPAIPPSHDGPWCGDEPGACPSLG